MRKFLAISLGLMFTFSSPVILAQKPTKKQVRSKSKKRAKKKSKGKETPGKKEFILGVRFFKAKEYEAALPLFRKAYELTGHRRSTVLALAQCERALKMYDDAIAHYREYLAMDPPNAEKIRETVKLTEQLLAAAGRSSKAPTPKPKVVEQAPQSTQTASTAASKKVDLVLKPKPKEVPLTDTEPQIVTSDDDSSGASVWLWTIGSIVVVGAGAAAGYYFWPQADAYGGSRGVIARPGE